jgi:hypothetical protein
MGLGSILGGLAGLFIPGGGAIASAIGSGIGSLVIDKEDPKDAIKNALIAGIGSKILGPTLQGSQVGRAITGGLGSMGLGTSAGLAALQSSTAPAAINAVTGQAVTQTATNQALTKGVEQAAGSGLMSKLTGNPMMMYAGLSALGAAENLATPQGDFGAKQYYSQHTGQGYDTPEERDEAEKAWRAARREQYGSDYAESNYGYAYGGYVEGPGTGRSDSIPADIYQNGEPVQRARLSDGEFVMTESAVRGAGNGDRSKGAAKMYAMMRDLERGRA